MSYVCTMQMRGARLTFAFVEIELASSHLMMTLPCDLGLCTIPLGVIFHSILPVLGLSVESASLAFFPLPANE